MLNKLGRGRQAHHVLAPQGLGEEDLLDLQNPDRLDHRREDHQKVDLVGHRGAVDHLDQRKAGHQDLRREDHPDRRKEDHLDHRRVDRQKEDHRKADHLDQKREDLLVLKEALRSD